MDSTDFTKYSIELYIQNCAFTLDSTDFTKYDIELYIQDCAFTIVVKTQDLFDEVQTNFLKLNPNKCEIIS